MNRRSRAQGALLVAVVIGWLTPASAVESLAERVARLEAMSPSEKDELAQKKARYDALPETEKTRLKTLAATIESQPDAAQLAGVMDRYHEWLKSLTASQLAELRELPEPERVERIKRLLHDQQRRTFLQIARQASPEDLEVVFEWNKTFVNEHRDRILKSLPGDFSRKMMENADEQRQELLLMFVMLSRRMGMEMPRPGKDEVEQLLPRLSPASQKLFNDTPEFFTRIELVSIWSWGALWSKAFPNVTTEQLAAVFAKMPASERDRLEKMSPREREVELKHVYARMNFFRREDWDERGPWEGREPRDRFPRDRRDGFHRRDGEPLGEDRRPHEGGEPKLNEPPSRSSKGKRRPHEPGQLPNAPSANSAEIEKDANEETPPQSSE